MMSLKVIIPHKTTASIVDSLQTEISTMQTLVWVIQIPILTKLSSLHRLSNPILSTAFKMALVLSRMAQPQTKPDQLLITSNRCGLFHLKPLGTTATIYHNSHKRQIADLPGPQVELARQCDLHSSLKTPEGQFPFSQSLRDESSISQVVQALSLLPVQTLLLE